jgi:hypothetical protein
MLTAGGWAVSPAGDGGDDFDDDGAGWDPQLAVTTARAARPATQHDIRRKVTALVQRIAGGPFSQNLSRIL